MIHFFGRFFDFAGYLKVLRRKLFNFFRCIALFSTDLTPANTNDEW